MSAPPLNILAFETSTERLSVGLAIDGRVRVERFADAPHSERILRIARALLDAAGVSVAALHGVAFGAGPGAFTGVRLGCGVAQGIALARDLPVVAVNSLQALAQVCISKSEGSRAAQARNVLAISDARLHEVYYGGWSITNEGVWREALATGLASPDAIAVPTAGEWIGCGSGFSIHSDALRARLGERLVAVAGTTHPDAEAVLALGAAALRRGEGVAPEHALPIYVRDKVALTTLERAAKAAQR